MWKKSQLQVFHKKKGLPIGNPLNSVFEINYNSLLSICAASWSLRTKEFS
jgi:hypothetical protein